MALVLVVPMFMAAWLVLRPPDVGLATAFFAMSVPTLASGDAMMSLLAWMAVAIAVSGTTIVVFRRVSKSHAGHPPTSFAAFLLVIGLLLLTISGVQRALPSASVCCGSGSANIREAMQLAR